MNSEKIGKMILQLRKEKNYTQKELAEKLYVSDKAVSKWERGIGCPDVSLMPRLSEVLGVDIKKLLEGDDTPNKKVHGDLRRCQFFYCKSCGNVVTSFSTCSLSCCGKVLEPLNSCDVDEIHRFTVEESDDSLYLSSSHEMTKEHYITFIALVQNEKIVIHKLYPEQMAETRFPCDARFGTLYIHCSRDGLMSMKVSSIGKVQTFRSGENSE